LPPKKDSKRHTEVLDAAIRLVREKGIDATSIQDIADAVGIKKGSVINYFSSKAELVELIEERFTGIATEGISAIVDNESGPEETLRALLRFHAEHCAINMSSPVLLSFMQLWAPMQSELGARQLEIRETYEDAFRGQIRACMRKRIIRKVNVDHLSHTMVGAMSWTAFWYDAERDGPLGPVVDKQIDIWFDGLRPRPRVAKG
jgi:AcrR family transcriptional regulator